MKTVVIAGYARSPFTPAKKGDLATVRPDDLAAAVVKGLVERTKVKVEDLEDLILGCAFPEGEQGLNLSRLVGLIAGLPLSWPVRPSTASAAPPCSRSMPPPALFRWVRARPSSAPASKA